ncbi:MAG TPA: NAD(P)H-quinone oxidoreductase [Pseudogracilibacillus sp.]|nr:NAD(P)H-quinone oxidoreductase [Pseudogracilibacillus sp.]
MKAVTVKQPGDADQLQIVDMEKPGIEDNEILVKVKATAINRTDIINRKSRLEYMTNPILGVEVAGEVVETGSNTNIEVGTAVMGLVNGGSYAEYVAMPEDRAMAVPKALSYEEAAAIPEVFLTAYQTLFWIGKLKEKETVLVHAGGSGVGTAAIQLAKQISKANVITTAGSRDKLEFCESLGADRGINYKEQDFPEEVLQFTDQQGAELILDFIGASYWDKNIKSIKVDGRWVLIGFLGGGTVNEVQLMDLMSKRIQLTGTLLTPRSDAYKKALSDDFVEHALPLFENKAIRPIVDKVFDLSDIAAAHEHMEANKNIGKIIVKVQD